MTNGPRPAAQGPGGTLLDRAFSYRGNSNPSRQGIRASTRMPPNYWLATYLAASRLSAITRTSHPRGYSMLLITPKTSELSPTTINFIDVRLSLRKS